MKRVITGDESWIYSYDLETVDQTTEYREKSTSEQIKNQGYAATLLRLSSCGALRINYDRPNYQQRILFEYVNLFRGTRFGSIDYTKRESLSVLKDSPGIDFNNCFEYWKTRWNKCLGDKWKNTLREETYILKKILRISKI